VASLCWNCDFKTFLSLFYVFLFMHIECILLYAASGVIKDFASANRKKNARPGQKQNETDRSIGDKQLVN